jgi:hypothetical protein
LHGWHTPGELWLQPKRYCPVAQSLAHATQSLVAASK